MPIIRLVGRWVLTAVFTLAVVADLAIVLQLLVHLCTGGLHGMNGWIVHIGSGGRIRIIETGPGTATVEFPSRRIACWNFARGCGSLLLLTLGSSWARRVLKPKTRAPIEP
jgi:hypothetical protein